jgi:hypothetical protein
MTIQSNVRPSALGATPVSEARSSVRPSDLLGSALIFYVLGISLAVTFLFQCAAIPVWFAWYLLARALFPSWRWIGCGGLFASLILSSGCLVATFYGLNLLLGQR